MRSHDPNNRLRMEFPSYISSESRKEKIPRLLTKVGKLLSPAGLSTDDRCSSCSRIWKNVKKTKIIYPPNFHVLKSLY